MFEQLVALFIVAQLFLNVQQKINQYQIVEDHLENTFEFSQRKIDAFYRWISSN